MSARDLAATVRDALVPPTAEAERRDAFAALAALEQQAADAQVARAVAEDAKALWDDANKRAVRAEEALRHMRDAVARADAKPRGGTYVMPSPDWIRIADYRNFGALAAAGADTP